MKNIIKELFVDKEEFVLGMIRKYELEQPLQNLINIVDSRIQKNDANVRGLNGIPSSFLTSINTNYLGKIQEKQEKEDLEYIIKELTLHLLNKYIQSVNEPKIVVMENLRAELKSACQLNKFDYVALDKIFPIETLVKFAQDTINKSEQSNLLSKPPVYYYDWNGLNNYDLDDLIKNLKAENHISDVRMFKKLFDKHSGNITISINRESLDFIIILFDILGDEHKRLIIPKGKNCGKFHPLKLYAVDFDKKVLINTEPKYIKFRIIKNKAYYLKLKGKAEKWVINYKTKS